MSEQETEMDVRELPYRLRVERGSPSGEELAALTVVLLARAAATGQAAPEGHRGRTARWRRPERGPGFESPRTWRQ
ncbi:acyl-CoA carboxylase subunit epsilon [Streptomyces sp. NPDC002680]|uniref:acyl-CoA carboxylase subunit epsilon n=1 Tax=Streptomyces sp. NPDC002680 TaxID=3364659 RepID=UPI0036A2FD00